MITIGGSFSIGGTDYKVAIVPEGDNPRDLIACDYTTGVNPVMFGGNGKKIWSRSHYTFFSRGFVVMTIENNEKTMVELEV